MLHCKLISQGSEALVNGAYTTAVSNFGNEFSSLTLKVFSSQIIDLMLDSYTTEETFEDWIDFARKILDCNMHGVVEFLQNSASQSADKYKKLVGFLKILDEKSLINAISNHTIYAIEPYLLESLLEKVREKDFNDVPSRLESELGFCDVKDARAYLENLRSINAETDDLELYELDTKDCTRIVELDQNFLNKINFEDPIHVVLGYIHGYWSGNLTEEPLREVILQGKLSFKGKLSV